MRIPDYTGSRGRSLLQVRQPRDESCGREPELAACAAERGGVRSCVEFDSQYLTDTVEKSIYATENEHTIRGGRAGGGLQRSGCVWRRIGQPARYCQETAGPEPEGCNEF